MTQGSHAWIVLLGEPQDLRLNVPVRSDGEDKSERWRGSWSDLLTEDTGILCVEDQFGGRPQQLAFKPSEGSPSLWSAGDNSWRFVSHVETRSVAFVDDRELFGTYVRGRSSAGERDSEGVVPVLAPKTEHAICLPGFNATALLRCFPKAAIAVAAA